MATGPFPVDKLHEASLLFAIRDINPRAPTHVLLISREHIPTARELTVEHGPLLAHMVGVANPPGGRPGARRARLSPRLQRRRRGRPDDLSPAPAPARRPAAGRGGLMPDIESRLRDAVEALPMGLRDHVLRVAAEAVRLADRHGVDRERGRIAG